MVKRIAVPILLLPFLVLLAQVHGQDDDNKLVWSHGLNLQVRPAGVPGFDDETKLKSFGSEAFTDKDLGKLVYVAETGAIGVGSVPATPVGREPKAPKLFHALELRVRGVGEPKFSDTTKKHGMEIFNDVNVGNLLYVTDTGSIAVLPTGSLSAPEDGKIKDPEWFHGLELKVRKPGEEDFDKADKVSLEVYKDPNTNQLVYVTHKGNVATVDAGSAKAPEDEVKEPTWFHAFDVKVRKADEKEFTKDTRTYGVEVYKDENVGMLIYVAHSGAIAVAPAGGLTKPKESKAPKWTLGRAFRVRRYDEPDFNEKTNRHGAEVYKDEITGNFVYVTHDGHLSVFAGK